LNSGQSQGFTIIELVIVMAIIGLLAGIAMPAFQDYTQQGRIAEAASLLTHSATQLENHYLETRQYGDVAGNCPPVTTSTEYFDIACSLPNGNNQQYNLTATSTGKLSQTKTITLSLNEQGTRSTELLVGTNPPKQFPCWLLSSTGVCR
jgi:type IV pilus assembly protein PilE